MTTKQRTLVDVPATPKLTEDQAFALELMRATGHDGMQSAALGAYIHAWKGYHPLDAPCDFCTSRGNQLLRALRRKGVARQRRVGGRTFWQAVDLPAERARGMSEEIPY